MSRVIDFEEAKAARMRALPAIAPWELIDHGDWIELRIGTLQLVCSRVAACMLGEQLVAMAEDNSRPTIPAPPPVEEE